MASGLAFSKERALAKAREADGRHDHNMFLYWMAYADRVGKDN